MAFMGMFHMSSSAPELRQVLVRCGRQATHVVGGLRPQEFMDCIEEFVALSQPCMTCFLDAAVYSLEHCQPSCGLNWCSFDCLRCENPYQYTLDMCVGTVLPAVTPCRTLPGACSGADVAAMDRAGPGHAPGTLPKVTYQCARLSYHVFSNG